MAAPKIRHGVSRRRVASMILRMEKVLLSRETGKTLPN
jgi:hypothetical protein